MMRTRSSPQYKQDGAWDTGKAPSFKFSPIFSIVIPSSFSLSPFNMPRHPPNEFLKNRSPYRSLQWLFFYWFFPHPFKNLPRVSKESSFSSVFYFFSVHSFLTHCYLISKLVCVLKLFFQKSSWVQNNLLPTPVPSKPGGYTAWAIPRNKHWAHVLEFCWDPASGEGLLVSPEVFSLDASLGSSL